MKKANDILSLASSVNGTTLKTLIHPWGLSSLVPAVSGALLASAASASSARPPACVDWRPPVSCRGVDEAFALSPPGRLD